MGTQMVTFPLCLLFPWRSQEILSPQTMCLVCSQSCTNRNKPHPKTICWKEFCLFHLPNLWSEVTFLCCQKGYASQKFLCRNIFKSIWSILSTEHWDIPCSSTVFLVDLLGLCWIATHSPLTAWGDLTFRVCRWFSSSSDVLNKQSF